MRQIAGAVLALTALATSVSACNEADPPQHAASDTPTTALPATDSPTPSPTPAKLPLASRVLAASDLPAALAGSRKRLPPTTVVGGCNRVPLLTIGATRTVTVSYAGSGHTVTSEVARVADEKSAALMLKSLRGLHDRCAGKTSAITPVAAPGVTSAWRYTATTSSGTDGFGVAVVGRMMTVVSLSADKPAIEAHLDDLVIAAAHRIG